MLIGPGRLVPASALSEDLNGIVESGDEKVGVGWGEAGWDSLLSRPSSLCCNIGIYCTKCKFTKLYIVLRSKTRSFPLCA